MTEVLSKVDNKRIDKYLSEELDYSREYIQKLITNGLVIVNGKKIKASYKVFINDKIEIRDDEFSINEDILPVKMDLNIVYEDEYLMVINKPSGLVVHPGSGNYNNTLVNGLMYYTKNLSNINGDVRPGIVHRIDKDTSGLIMVAKTNKVHETLADDFKNKRVRREYLALLDGVFKNSSATIDAPIGRDKVNREKMAVTELNSKNAITHMKVLKKYENNTLVSCILDTGRTHQIRVHMAYIGYPVHNDPVYSKKESSAFGQFLHSYKMNFVHPITKEEMSFECPLPDEFQKYLDELERANNAS